jgi:hypothetical protein
MDAGLTQGPGTGTTATSAGDWSLWWGTFRDQVDGRLLVWRCSDAGLNLGEPILVMTVADAHHRRLDDEAVFRAYLASRFGVGRYRITPRSEQGTKLPGTHSLVTVIAEDSTMLPPTPTTAPMLTAPMDHDTAIEIERMRLAAEMEREREARCERQREQREERRRERDQERERRRQEDRVRRDEDERRRSDRDAQTQTMLMQVLKEMAAGRSAASADPLVAAALAKLGQPDPLVLKLLDNHGKREELTDFFKVQAESMRMASTLQTDSLKQVMVASQEVQSQLMRQAAEVASHRDGGDGWSGIGSVLSATASIVATLRGEQRVGGPAVPPSASPVPPPMTLAASQPLPALPRYTPARVIAPLPSSPAQPADLVGDSLRQVRAIHHAGTADDTTLHQVVARLPAALRQAIRTGDVVAIQHEVMPAVQRDPTLGEWLSQPGVGDWLTTYLQRLRVEGGGERWDR